MEGGGWAEEGARGRRLGRGRREEVGQRKVGHRKEGGGGYLCIGRSFEISLRRRGIAI